MLAAIVALGFGWFLTTAVLVQHLMDQRVVFHAIEDLETAAGVQPRRFHPNYPFDRES